MEKIEDPFFEAKEQISFQLSKARYLYDLYFKTVKEKNIGSSTTLLDISNELWKIINEIDDCLIDLEEVVCAVESQPKKYKISDEEASERRLFVNRVRNDLEQMQKDLNDPIEDLSYRKDELLKQTVRDEESLNNSLVMSPKLALKYRKLLEDEQDIQLDHVFGTVQNLREQASIMGKELEEQFELIEEVDMRIERTGEKLKQGFKNMKWVIKRNEDTISSYCIVFLIIILIVLLILIFLF
ncbi:hypothetical protein PNEG_02153 [Pneumocystis murina B123]|uniref:t-SNARE affecting a late Golgi compartment protein 1 n=1 Tax=Pneumocystis murina (strain B123) TaxID=1069680 RepID=M7NQM4_PNEMU|nr:hypothetical protein PNEG_02153 [Pneumocystis murina B123]EMR09567.1 hypothetical protein PNEG_02153 [Pneumocystis murina B123]